MAAPVLARSRLRVNYFKILASISNAISILFSSLPSRHNCINSNSARMAFVIIMFSPPLIFIITPEVSPQPEGSLQE